MRQRDRDKIYALWVLYFFEDDSLQQISFLQKVRVKFSHIRYNNDDGCMCMFRIPIQIKRIISDVLKTHCRSSYCISSLPYHVEVTNNIGKMFIFFYIIFSISRKAKCFIRFVDISSSLSREKEEEKFGRTKLPNVKLMFKLTLTFPLV